MKTLALLALFLLAGCSKDNPAGPAPTPEPGVIATTLAFALTTTQAFPADSLKIGCVLFTCDGGPVWLEPINGGKLYKDTVLVGKSSCMLGSEWSASDSTGERMGLKISDLYRVENITGNKVFLTIDLGF